MAKLRSGAGRRSVDGLERILLDEVAVINQRPVQGVLNVAQLVDGAHGFAVFALDVSCQGLDGIEHHLVGGHFAEVLNQVLGILSKCRDVPLDDGLLLVGQKIVAQVKEEPFVATKDARGKSPRSTIKAPPMPPWRISAVVSR